MAPTELIDRVALNHRLAHDGFRLALRGALANALAHPNPASDAAKVMLLRAIEASKVALTHAAPALRDGIRQVKEAALRSIPGNPLDPVLEESIDEMLANTEAAIELVTEADIRVALEHMRQFRLRLSMQTMGRNFSQAINNTRAEFRGLEPNFRVADRGGKKWTSGTYVETAVRALAVQVYADSAVFGMARTGIKTGQVKNPGHDNDGMLFSTGPSTATLPSYQDIRDEVFHPNTNAYPVMLES